MGSNSLLTPPHCAEDDDIIIRVKKAFEDLTAVVNGLVEFLCRTCSDSGALD